MAANKKSDAIENYPYIVYTDNTEAETDIEPPTTVYPPVDDEESEA